MQNSPGKTAFSLSDSLAFQSQTRHPAFVFYKIRRRAEKADVVGVMLAVDGGCGEGYAISTAQILGIGRTLVTLMNQPGCESCSSHFVD